MRRAILLSAIATAAWSAAPLLAQAPTDSTALVHAREIMRSIPLIDGHNDLPYELRQKAGGDLDSLDIAVRQDSLMTDIPRLREGLVGAQFFVAYVPVDRIGNGAARFALMQIDLIHRMAERYPDTFEFARTAEDIRRIFDQEKIGVLIGLEGGHAIEGSLDLLRAYYDLGVRYITLTHWASHDWADSATDEPRWQGLRPGFGEDVIREMNRLGVLVDLSHVSDSTMVDVMRISRAPVIYSHSSARALDQHVRNVPDEILRRLGTNGGIIMVNYAPDYVSEELRLWSESAGSVRDSLRARFEGDTVAMQAAFLEWRDANPRPDATLSQVADHLDHLVATAGVDHVGIGSDFDGIGFTPVGLEDVSTFPDLVAELVRRGHPDEDIRKILGGNLLRVLDRAEQVAAQMREEIEPIIGTLPSPYAEAGEE
ncbi:MAG TPA: dipeptidase [Gemmatimonadota bacterium]|nr:dipeptidase [Gemmatimonadota bacterium]